MEKKCIHLIDSSQISSNKNKQTNQIRETRLYLANTQINMTQSFTDGF